MSDDYVARTSDALEELTGFVHDEWFKLDDIEYIVDDEARVGDYEVDYLTVDEDGRVVQLHATIPLQIDFHVDEIDVSFLPAAPGQP